MNKIEKAKRGFNYACKQASRCRHELYQVSCFSCAQRKTCEIQKRLEAHKEILSTVKWSN